jgi:hypothetical protein
MTDRQTKTIVQVCGPGDRDLLESALRSTGTALQYSRLPQKVPPKTNYRLKNKFWFGTGLGRAI